MRGGHPTEIPVHIRRELEAEQAALRAYEELSRGMGPRHVDGAIYFDQEPDEKIERLTDFMEAQEAEWQREGEER